MKQNSVGSSVIFADGYVAGVAGEPRTTNPHQKDSGAASVWIEGWEEGHEKRTLGVAKPEPLELPSA